uniref:PROP1-like PPR domain-containing protein n=1 Tax=Zooxanthella nutricula TaxID=1333877 RepID=A0A7S2Q5U2_9DINO
MLADMPGSTKQSDMPEIRSLRAKVVRAVRTRHIPDSATLMAFIRALASKGQVDEAEYWFQVALRLGVQTTEVAFEFLVTAFAKNKRFETAVRYFNGMVDAGLSPSASCFNTVLHACSKVGDVDMVEKLRKQNVERRWEISGGAHHAVIKMLVKQRQVHHATSWSSHMIASGRAVAPMTFNLLIDACAKAGESRSAEAHLARMIDQGCEPNLITYNSVVNAFATTGGSRRAEEWVRRMSAAGIEPDEVTYGALCKAYARRGQPEKVQKVIDSLPERGMEANQYFYASLIGACARARPTQHLRAEQAFCEGVRRGVGGALLLHHLRRAVGSARAHSLCLEQGLDRGALEAIAPRED